MPRLFTALEIPDHARVRLAALRAGQPVPVGDGGASFIALISTQLTPAQVAAAQGGGAAGLQTAGGQYMTALADTFHEMIKRLRDIMRFNAQRRKKEAEDRAASGRPRGTAEASGARLRGRPARTSGLRGRDSC